MLRKTFFFSSFSSCLLIWDRLALPTHAPDFHQILRSPNILPSYRLIRPMPSSSSTLSTASQSDLTIFVLHILISYAGVFIIKSARFSGLQLIEHNSFGKLGNVRICWEMYCCFIRVPYPEGLLLREPYYWDSAV